MAGAAIYAFANGFEASNKTAAGALLIAVPALTALITAALWWQRKKYYDKHTWFARYGFMIDNENGGYLLPAEQEFDDFVSSVVRVWIPFHPAADRLMKSEVKWVHFRKGMDEVPLKPKWGLLKGATLLGGAVIYVDYNFKLESLEKTALDHELGHVIHGLATGGWDQEEHHAFAKENSLP